jgi:hypothetical protein
VHNSELLVMADNIKKHSNLLSTQVRMLSCSSPLFLNLLTSS